MDAYLLNNKGQVIDTTTNQTRMKHNPNARGDIYKIGQILNATGADLD
ncbi:18099_t:CDS:2, partial [Racocetra persica]